MYRACLHLHSTHFNCRVASRHFPDKHEHIVSQFVIGGLNEVFEEKMRPKRVHIHHYESARSLLAVEATSGNLFRIKEGE